MQKTHSCRHILNLSGSCAIRRHQKGSQVQEVPMHCKYRLRSVSKKHSHKTNLLDMSVRPIKRRKHCLGPHILTRNKSLRSIKDPESPPYVEWAPVPKSVLCQAWRRSSRSSVVLANTLRGLTFASPWVFFYQT